MFSSRLSQILLAVFLVNSGCALAALAGRRRQGRSRLISGYMLLAALWALATALEISVRGFEAKLLWANMTVFAFGFLPFVWLLVVLFSVQGLQRPPRLWLLLLLIEPLLLNVPVWTKYSQTLVWETGSPQTAGLRAALAFHTGPLIRVHTAVAILVILGGGLMLFLKLRPSQRRTQALRLLAMLAAGLLPWLFDAATRYNPNLAAFYLTPLVSALSAPLLCVFLFPVSLSELLPFDYETIVNSMRDPVIVLDQENRVIKHNTAAEKVIARARDLRAEKPAATPLEMLNARVNEDGEIIIGRGRNARLFDMGLSPLLGRKKKRRGNIIVLRDISARKEVEEELRSLNQRIRQDLERAAGLQASLLPRSVPRVPGVRFEWIFEPCDELAGDLFNIFRLDEEHVGFYLLDVSGHGLVAALLSFALGRLLSPLPDQSSLLKRYSNSERGNTLARPVEVADILNLQFPFSDKTQQYFSLFYGIYNFKSRLLRYVSAGHSGFAYLPAGGKAAIRALPSYPIGFHETPHYSEQRLRLAPGDRVYLYSDGIVEALDGSGQQFGNERFLKTLEASSGVSLRRSLDTLLATVRDYSSGIQRSDDMSILALETGTTQAAGA
jgi:sigma-B regulation protein RsbU (phosphoserine phosphatase)